MKDNSASGFLRSDIIVHACSSYANGGSNQLHGLRLHAERTSTGLEQRLDIQVYMF